MEPISFTASAPFAICRKICCLWLAILLILCIITYTSIRVFIFTRISFSITSSKVDLGQLCFSTSELLSSCIVYGNKIIVIVVILLLLSIVSICTKPRWHSCASARIFNTVSIDLARASLGYLKGKWPTMYDTRGWHTKGAVNVDKLSKSLLFSLFMRIGI